MASEKDRKNIESIFEEKTVILPNDEELKSNIIRNKFRSEHGKIMSDHAHEYTNLLRMYIKNSKQSSEQKKKFKNVFFWVAISTLGLSFLLFSGISIYFSIKGFEKIDISDLSGLISSLVGLLSLYLIIPRIIAEYLFNVKEDEHMAKIVNSVQTYDEKVFSSMNEYDFEETVDEDAAAYAMKNLKKEAENKDSKEEMEDFGKTSLTDKI